MHGQHQNQTQSIKWIMKFELINLRCVPSFFTDDIDLDDHVEKRKDHGILGIGALNKKKLTGKFQALKG